MVSGGCTEPLPPLMDSNSTGSALFTKTPHTATGAVGVFTYDLIKKSTKNTTGKIAVMILAVGIFDKSQACNYDLHYQMKKRPEENK